ncbi:MAG TPA: PAS domain S-box protein [Spirochaetota bacterium]|nr:PAS domain S-box protein [Spirochaetota bacterium]
MDEKRNINFSFLDCIQQPCIIINRNGTIVFANNSFCQNYSFNEDKIKNASIEEICSNHEVLFDAMVSAFSIKGKINIKELSLKNNNILIHGICVPFDSEHVILYSDVSDGELLRKSKMLVQTILDTIPRQIVIVDHNYSIIMANSEWKRFVNEVLEIPGDSLHHDIIELCDKGGCLYDETKSRFSDAIRAILSGRQSLISFESKIYHNENTRWFQFNFFGYTLNGIKFCVIIFTDITDHKVYQEIIQQQRDTFQKYLDISPFMIVLVNPEGKITLVNSKACEILGYTSEELLGKDWFDTCLPHDVAIDVKKTFIELMKGNIKPVEFYENPIVTKSGELKLIAWHNTIIYDANGTILASMSSGEDITQKKQMEIELLKSSTNLKAIVKAFPDIYVIADKDGYIVDYQYGDEKILYATREETLGKTFYDVMPTHIATLYASAVDDAMSTNTIQSIEYTIQIGDESRWREARLVPVIKNRVLAVIRDVTQRKNAELALIESGKRYRNLVQRIPAAIIEMNIQGDIIFINDYFEKITGFTLSDLKGTHWFRSMIHPQEDKRKIRQFIEQIQQGDVSNFEIHIINKEGEDTYLTITTSNIYNKAGKLERIVCIATDVTPIIAMRENLREMAIKDELTGLYNRRGFMMLAEQQMKINRRSELGMAIFYVDMDNMKLINDTFGHHEGDKALIDAAAILRLCFRDSDIIGRMGGDEFAILAIDCNRHDIEIMQNRLIENINEFNAKSLREYQLSLSIGSIFIHDSSGNIEDILVRADKTMYRNKLERKKQRH